MKLQGQTFTGPNEAFMVLPHNGADLIFKARAILDYSRCDALAPRPKAKMITKVGGIKEELVTDPAYLSALDRWSSQRTAYTIVESLKATPDLQWDTIKDEEPETWGNYRKELEDAFFSTNEIAKIINLVWEANGLDDEKLEEARKRFLAGQVLLQNQLS